MTPVLRVAAPGMLTSVQDLGRTGYQHLGIAVSGALDAVSLQAANALAGNPAGTGALEATYVGPTLVAEAEDVRLAIVGADAAIELLPNETAAQGFRIDGMRSVRLSRGEAVRIGSLSGSKVIYIAVEGGFDIAPVLGSVSTYVRGGFGGWQGRALTAGDRLPLRRDCATEREEWRLEGLDLSAPTRLRVIAGPQSDHFSERGIATFFATDYVVGPSSDRMGMRLDGPRVDHVRGFNITSDAIAPGSIQIPGDGQPIVLLADRQTTGGYPKIATVISADLPALGRLRIGARIRFEPVTLEAAAAARRAFALELAGLSDKIVPVRLVGASMAPRLMAQNLISGVVDAYG